jgi:lysophospholipase L1-like esterase
MNRSLWLLPFVFALPISAREVAPLPASLSAYQLTDAPRTEKPVLKKGDRLAICGDSITEQKQYSVLMETYLTACHPELEIACRQHGWSGEQASGFLNRMKSDVLRFKPDVATTCYGMNDFRYVPYEDGIAAEYRKNQTAVVEMFQKAGCQVVLGSPGIIMSVPPWVQGAKGDRTQLNQALSRFRNIDVEIAKARNVPFADVYRPMLLASEKAMKSFGPDFHLAGNDGVHPAWAGHVVMAFAFLEGLGMDGDLGSVTYDEAAGAATAANGHEALSTADGKITIRSSRLVFAPGPGALDKDDSIRAGMALVPFDDALNRFILKVKSPKSASYKVTWGGENHTYTAAQLTAGVNLAKDFASNPLVPAFKKVMDAVAKKQDYETREIKQLAHGPEGAADLDATFALAEKARAPLEQAVRTAVQPTEHVIAIAAAP